MRFFCFCVVLMMSFLAKGHVYYRPSLLQKQVLLRSSSESLLWNELFEANLEISQSYRSYLHYLAVEALLRPSCQEGEVRVEGVDSVLWRQASQNLSVSQSPDMELIEAGAFKLLCGNKPVNLVLGRHGRLSSHRVYSQLYLQAVRLLHQKLSQKGESVSVDFESSLPFPQFQLDQLPEYPINTLEGAPTGELMIFTRAQCRPCVKLYKDLLASNGKISQDLLMFPAFAEEEGFQQSFFEKLYCLNEQSSDSIGSAYRLSEKVRDLVNMEQDFFVELENQKLDRTAFLSCIADRKYKDVIDYHGQFSQYLDVKGYPLVLSGGFAFQGVISLEGVENSLRLYRAQNTNSWKVFFWQSYYKLEAWFYGS